MFKTIYINFKWIQSILIFKRDYVSSIFGAFIMKKQLIGFYIQYFGL